MLLVLMLLLVLLAAIGLGPEGPHSLGPAPTPPRFEAGVGDSEALVAPGVALIARGVAVSKPQRSADRRIVRPAEEGTGRALAVSPGQAVAVAEPTPAQAPAPTSEAQPVSVPTPELAAAPPAPAPAPAAPSPSGTGGGQGGPIVAGVEPEPVCEGDEYAITATFIAAGEEGEAPLLEILLQRHGSDGSNEELRLEGSPADLQSLVITLTGEGGCVSVQIESPAGEESEELP